MHFLYTCSSVQCSSYCIRFLSLQSILHAGRVYNSCKSHVRFVKYMVDVLVPSVDQNFVCFLHAVHMFVVQKETKWGVGLTKPETKTLRRVFASAR